ncbi:MAG: N-acetyltransferase, partial [Synergistaceae bacterium]|nr:N-acetyltransferase [Synergistaceae bacterium]
SRQTEARIVDALRDAGALAISLVAEFGGKVVGHIAFSRVSISDGTRDWYGIGPLSVLPGFQGRGLGSALVRSGLDRLRRIGGKGCVLVGEPQYYERFGFKSDPNLTHEDIPAEYFMALSLEPQSKNDAPAGIVTFHEGFDVK